MEDEKTKEDLKDYSEYLCPRCRKFFSFEDFNLEKGLCKNCRDKEKKQAIENRGSESSPEIDL